MQTARCAQTMKHKSNATSHPEVVADGESGVLVEPGQPNEAASALVELARSPARRAELGTAARARAVERFSSDAMLDRYESFLEEIVLQTPPSTHS